MSIEIAGIIVLFFLLIFGGMWIPFAVILTSLAIIYVDLGVAGLRGIGFVGWGSMDSFTLTAVPLFILMAELMLQSGLGERLYRGLGSVANRVPGGFLQANIIGCAIFAAISGSSVATAAAIGTIAVPELKARNYDMRLTYGSLAAGGTLGILIPPSIALIIYATLSDTSVVKLFMAGVVPGLLLTLLFAIYVAFAGRKSGARSRESLVGQSAQQEEKPRGSLKSFLGDVLPFTTLIVVILVSLYFGVATPTEAAGFGCSAAAVISATYGQLSLKVIRDSLRNTLRVSGAILFVVLSAYFFSYALSMSGVNRDLTNWVASLALNRYAFLGIIFALYLILGCFIESIAMIVITVPLLFPVIMSYGFDPIWFGVFLVAMIELGQISPPFGINLFVIQSLSGDRIEEVIAGTVPYYGIILLFYLTLVAVPELALWLPSQM